MPYLVKGPPPSPLPLFFFALFTVKSEKKPEFEDTGVSDWRKILEKPQIIFMVYLVSKYTT
jgi:hypothetical protein